MLIRLAAVVLALLALSLQVSSMGMPKKEKIPHNKSDLKYIRCAVCEEVSKVVHRTVADMRRELPVKKKLKEIDILEKVEEICDPKSDAGSWISHFDLAEEDGNLKVKDMGGPGKCKVECMTTARACIDVLDDHDTDVAEAMFKGDMNRAKLNQMLCYDLTDVCLSKPPKLKSPRDHDEEWVEADPKELEVEKMMRDMQEAGMPGMSMYGRDELQEQMAAMGDYGDMYGEEEDDLYEGMEDYLDQDTQAEL